MNLRERLRTIIHNRRGYTLLEVLITLSIFLIVLYSVYMVYDTQRSSYSRTEARIDTQDNARMALSTLQREIRMAGYGVPRALTTLPRIVEARPRLIIFRADLRGVITTLAANAASGSNTLTVNATTGIAAGDVIYLSDDTKALALTVLSVNTSTSTVTTTAALSKSFASGSRLYVPRDVQFTITSGQLRRQERVPGGSWSTYTVFAGLLQDADCFRYYNIDNTEITSNNPVANPDSAIRRIGIQLTASLTPAGLDPQSYTLRCDADLRNL